MERRRAETESVRARSQTCNRYRLTLCLFLGLLVPARLGAGFHVRSASIAMRQGLNGGAYYRISNLLPISTSRQ